MPRTDENWIQTWTGLRFWPLDPSPEDICIEDIAHALSMKCRYAGHCNVFYSVAQHSVLVSEIVPQADKLWALLHDASEAYLPDVARPVKAELPGFREIEDRLMQCVADKFGLSWPEPPSVKHADMVLLRTERRDLMNTPPRPWKSDEQLQPLPKKVVHWSQMEAKKWFLAFFRSLWQ